MDSMLFGLQLHLDIFKRPGLLSADALAVEGSRFVQVNALRVHALRSHAPSGSPQRILHFNHGFGASSFSFSPVLSRLSTKLNATAVAHDCPGESTFGTRRQFGHPV